MSKYRAADSLTVELVRAALHYDAETGDFFRRRDGVKAGCLNSQGYVQITISGARVLGHRLAWFYITGKWPDDEIDHKDLNRSRNAWENLRPSSRRQNCFNVPAHKDGSSGGVKGISWSAERKKWVAQIMINRKQTNLGRFDSKEEAHAAYAAKAREHFGEFARF